MRKRGDFPTRGQAPQRLGNGPIQLEFGSGTAFVNVPDGRLPICISVDAGRTRTALARHTRFLLPPGSPNQGPDPLRSHSL
jgi:hypothetical protein